MLQNIEDKEEIEVITIDSDIEVDLDFDFDFSGFNSNEVIKFKDYNDKFTNMLRKSKNSEKEEYVDLSFEEEIDNFGDFEEFGFNDKFMNNLKAPTENEEDLDLIIVEESDDNNAEVEEEMEENQSEEISAEDMDSENSQDELPHLEVINWDSPDFNVDNMWKNTFSFWKQQGGSARGFQTF